MTVQAAVKMWSRHDGSVETTDGRKKKASIRETYQIVCDATDGLVEVLTATSLPTIGARYSDASGNETWLDCKKRNPKQISPVFWHVDVVYEGEFGPNGITDSPLNDPPEVSWTNVGSDEPIDEDIFGNPICTVNSEMIEGVTMQIHDLQLTVQRNYESISLPATHAYLHSVNSDEFAGFAPGIAKLMSFTAKETIAKELAFGYWEVTATIQFRFPYNTTPERTWWKRVRHEGYYIWRPDIEEVVEAMDGHQKPVSRPVLLRNDSGIAYPRTRPPDPIIADWLEFQVYAPLPYNDLGLL